MALEGVILNEGAGGQTVATDRVGGLDYQVVKLATGADGTADLVGDASPIPVSDAGASLTVDGTVELGATTLAALETIELGATTLAALETVTVNVGNTPNTTPILASLHDGTTRASVADLTNANPLHVAIVDGSGNQVTSFGGSGGTSGTDDAAFTPASTAITPVGGIVTSDSVDSGDMGAFAMLANRQQKVTLYDSAGVELAVGGGTQYTEDAVAAANPVGNAIIVIRDDSRSGSLTTANGDNVALRGNNVGELYVKHADAIPITDNAGSLTVDGTVELGATTLAALETISVTALPAGTNNIGDVDILSVVPGTAATSLGKAEDAAHTTGDTGVMALAVRRDADTTLADTTGDYVPLQVNAAGSLKVAITSGAGSGGTSAADGATFTRDTTSITPVGAVVETSAPTLTNGDAAGLSMTTGGALRVSVASGGVAGIIDDAAFTPGTTEGVMFMAHADESAADAVDEGDAGAVRMTLNRALHTTLRCADGVTAMDETNDSVRVTIVSGAGSGGTSMADDAAFTPGTTTITPIGAMFDDVTPDSVNEGDGGVVRMSANRNMYVTLRDSAGNERGLNIDANNAIAVGNVATIGTSVTPGTAATNLGKAEDAAHTSGDVGVMAMTVRANTAAALSGTDNDYQPLITDTNGRLHTIDANGAAALTALQLIDNPVVVDDAAFTPATTSVMMAGYQADEATTDSIDEGDAGAARMTLDRKQIVTEYVHAAAGGASSYAVISAAAVLSAEIKGSAGKVFSIQVFNVNAAARFVRLYNQTGAPGTGDTANVLWRGIIPGNIAGAGFTVHFPKGKQFSTGIGIRASAAVADNDATVLAANELFFNVDYA